MCNQICLITLLGIFQGYLFKTRKKRKSSRTCGGAQNARKFKNWLTNALATSQSTNLKTLRASWSKFSYQSFNQAKIFYQNKLLSQIRSNSHMFRKIRFKREKLGNVSIVKAWIIWNSKTCDATFAKNVAEKTKLLKWC